MIAPNRSGSLSARSGHDGAAQPGGARGERRERGGHEERARGEPGVPEPAAAQRREEARAAREPHRVDEQGEAEGGHELGELQRRVRGAGAEANEQHRRHAEVEAADPQAPDEEADGGDEEEEQERVVREEANHGIGLRGCSGAAPRGNTRGYAGNTGENTRRARGTPRGTRHAARAARRAPRCWSTARAMRTENARPGR
ncbi:hypothetical protein WMF24_22195 [Sorangium sp. So ce1335]